MFSDEVVVRLKQKNWYVKCRNEQEAILVLLACDAAGIRWLAGEKPTGWYPFKFKSHSFDIGFLKDDKGITTDCCNTYEKYEAENITDWFFKAIKGKIMVSNDSNTGKLTSQNARLRHLVQAILAMARGNKLEVYSKDENKWIDLSNASSISIKCKYRLKVTPLSIPRKLWGSFDKDIRFCAINRYGLVCFYKQRPKLYEDGWRVTNNPNDRFPASPRLFPQLYIYTDGINWKTSLTERPEGV